MSMINPALANMSPFIVMEVLERANAMEKQGIRIIHMEVGEPDFEVPVCVAEATNMAINRGQTHYTHSLGTRELREAIAHFYRKEYEVEVNPDCVVVTSGSSPAILLVLMTLCAVGDEVILSNPGYSCYRNFAIACNAVPVDVPLSANNGFQYVVDDVKRAISPRTRAIFVNSPMNPTGTLVEDFVFEQLVTLDVPIISDEIYHGLVYEGKARSILEFTDNAFVINGFSKRFAMTGLRLGYIIAPQTYIRTLQILQQNLFICAPSIAQEAGIIALKNAQNDVDRMRDIYNERRLYMLDRLIKMGFEVRAVPQGAFYIFCDAHRFTKNSYQFAFDVLDHAHVGITPGIDFGSRGEGFVRFSYANSLANIREGLDRLETYLLSKK
ncbi:MAG: pyridoxal phosphate-dependent aminotransferase [Bacteroidota bacterium]|nr:pyridoxal phosphate-dependent aminotransferase [Bacteroidota bacterium]